MRPIRSILAVIIVALGVSLVPALAAAPPVAPKDLPPLGAEKPFPAPQVIASRLDDGLTVWLVPRTGIPKVAVQFVVRGGLAADPASAAGVSELLAATLTQGTTTRTSQQIAQELQGIGGALNAEATEDGLFVSGTALANQAPRLVALLADVVRNATFPKEEVELARENAIQQLKANEATPAFIGSRAFRAAVYGSHPYRTTSASEAVLRAATPEALRAEYARRFRPGSALLVVAGQFDPVALGVEIGKQFGAWTSSAPALPAVPPQPTAEARKIVLVDRPGSVQSMIMIGRPVLAITDPDYFPLEVANTICAGSFGSRLTHNIREDKGYTYSPRGSVSERAAGGLLQLRADVRNEVTSAALMEMLYEMDRMATTAPDEEELSRAKHAESGFFAFQMQIGSALANALAENWVLGLGPEVLAQFVPKVNAVTAEDVRRVGRAFYPSMKQTIAVVGDTSKVKSELEMFGPVADAK